MKHHAELDPELESHATSAGMSKRDTSELRIQKPNVLAVECQADSFNARISFDDLLKSALRWSADRIILGEVRGIEARILLALIATLFSVYRDF
jgi:Flp pilus assembly CpaF family ATPase